MQQINNRLAALRRRYNSRLKNQTSLDKINALARIKSRRKEIFNIDNSKELNFENTSLSKLAITRRRIKSVLKKRQRFSNCSNKDELEVDVENCSNKDELEVDRDKVCDVKSNPYLTNAHDKRNNDNNISKVLLMSFLSSYIDEKRTFNNYNAMCRQRDIWINVKKKFNTYGISYNIKFLMDLWKTTIESTQMNIIEKEKSDEIEFSDLDMEMMYFFPELISETIDEIRNNAKTYTFADNADSDTLKDHTYCYIPSSPEDTCPP